MTKKYINKNEKEGNILYGDYDLPRAFVLHEDKEKKKYGDGSVWQRKDGRWEGSFSAGID